MAPALCPHWKVASYGLSADPSRLATLEFEHILVMKNKIFQVRVKFYLPRPIVLLLTNCFYFSKNKQITLKTRKQLLLGHLVKALTTEMTLV